jgi:hypothetical protein
MWPAGANTRHSGDHLLVMSSKKKEKKKSHKHTVPLFKMIASWQQSPFSKEQSRAGTTPRSEKGTIMLCTVKICNMATLGLALSTLKDD